MGGVSHRFTPGHHSKFSHRQGQDLPSTPDDIRSRFYEDYHQVAEEYDKEFNKRYDEDLNTTLIFVSLISYSDIYVLNQTTGWSVFSCHFCLHHRGWLPAPARPK